MGALELQHYNGPWDSPDNQRKMNAVMRYSSGDPDDGYSLTAMYYGGLWNATTDQPVRAITQGLIGRFGSLDPTDGGQAQRYSLSGQYHGALGPGALEAHAYAIGNRLTLWNDFTHFLTDPVAWRPGGPDREPCDLGRRRQLSRVGFGLGHFQ